MAASVAVAASLATTHRTRLVPSLLFSTKLRSVTSPSSCRISPCFPLHSRIAYNRKAMAGFLVRANLGLTEPAIIKPLKISFTAKDTDVVQWQGDLLAVGVTEKDVAKTDGNEFENPLLKVIDAKLRGNLSEASSEENFTGKVGQSLVLRLPGLGSKRVGLFGLGQGASNSSDFHNFGNSVAAAAKGVQAESAAITLASTGSISHRSKLIVAAATGTVLGIYEDLRYKSDPKTPVLETVDILGFGTGPDIEKKLKYAEDLSSAVIFGRELVNSPANVLTPEALAGEASKIANTYSDVMSATIFTPDQCVELKMGSFLGVAAAATENPSRFIHLCYKPPSGSVTTKLALVGKGITFDSGGYNLKTGTGSDIELMKNDMGGTAAILGAAKVIGEIKPPGVEVHFIAAATENMISASGMRPGDIVTASNGTTIEVNNTDAEGRLVLADALIYACNQGVDKVVNLATLTGACVVALGPSVAGAFTPSDELAKEIFSAAEISGEKFWRLPLEESYWQSMKSGIADMINTGPRNGGAITAALFLKQFVDEKVQWMHMDIAGPVWNREKSVGTGFGITTLVEWVLQNSS